MGAGVGDALPILMLLLLARKILKHVGAADTTPDWETMDALIVLPWECLHLPGLVDGPMKSLESM